MLWQRSESVINTPKTVCFKRVRWNERLAPAANGSWCCCWCFMGQKNLLGLSYISSLLRETRPTFVARINAHIYICLVVVVIIFKYACFKGSREEGEAWTRSSWDVWLRAVSQILASCLPRKRLERHMRIRIKCA